MVSPCFLMRRRRRQRRRRQRSFEPPIAGRSHHRSKSNVEKESMAPAASLASQWRGLVARGLITRRSPLRTAASPWRATGRRTEAAAATAAVAAAGRPPCALTGAAAIHRPSAANWPPWPWPRSLWSAWSWRRRPWRWWKRVRSLANDYFFRSKILLKCLTFVL